tara:strand:+ start:62045 stop:62878 length:834 start_codon:yes stop_codon:yes gene_type:complete
MEAMVWWVLFKKLILHRKLAVHNLFFDGLATECRKIREGAARWPAMDIIYNFRKKQLGWNPFKWPGIILDNFWIHMRNAQAVRNRFKRTRYDLERSCYLLKNLGRPIRILSLACGSAQAVAETVALLSTEGYQFEVLLIDYEEGALKKASEIAEKYRIGDCFTYKRGVVQRFPKYLDGFKPDIVEMVGFFDYLNDKQAVEVVELVHEMLPQKGTFITCHIHPNPEQDFLTNVIGWDSNMLYRSVDEFANLVDSGGFDKVQVVIEPLGIHSVLVATKT